MKIRRFNEGIVFKKYAHLFDYLRNKFHCDNVIFYEDEILNITLVFYYTISKSEFENVSVSSK